MIHDKYIEAAKINFRDIDTADDGVAVIRYNSESVALCLSLAKNGDLEVFMTKTDAKKLAAALNTAIS